MNRLSSIAVTVALVWIAVEPDPAGAQSRYSAQVEFQFSLIRAFAESVEFSQVHKPILSSLRDDAEESQTISLEGDMECRIMALCDADCSDVDLFVVDPSGREVGSDTGSSDAPIVSIRTVEGGEYQVRVRMAVCREQPCYYGIAAFGRTGRR